MRTSTAVTIHGVADEGRRGPSLASGALVTPVLVLAAAEPGAAWLTEPHLAVALLDPDGGEQQIGVREVTIRSTGTTGPALVGLTLEDASTAARDVVPDLDSVAEDDPDRLAAVALAHLTGDALRFPADPDDDDDPLGLFCRLFGMGCPRGMVVV